MSRPFLVRCLVYCNIILVSLIVIATPACATLKKGFHAKVVDKELQPYTATYFDLLKQECPNYNINKHQLFVIELVKGEDLEEERWIGVCSKLLAGFHIRIKQEWWLGANENERLQLMFHEMAHCLIDREHDPSVRHYMYAYFGELPRETYFKQARKDIQDYCNE